MQGVAPSQQGRGPKYREEWCPQAWRCPSVCLPNCLPSITWLFALLAPYPHSSPVGFGVCGLETSSTQSSLDFNLNTFPQNNGNHTHSHLTHPHMQVCTRAHTSHIRTPHTPHVPHITHPTYTHTHLKYCTAHTHHTSHIHISHTTHTHIYTLHIPHI